MNRVSNVIPGRIPIQKDEFPILEFSQIARSLQGNDLIISEELISRPTSAYIQLLLVQILDTFVGITAEYSAEAKKKLLRNQEIGGASLALENGFDELLDSDESELNSYDLSEAVSAAVLHQSINLMMTKCGIYDFCLSDLARPEPQRVRRFLSAIVNMALHRENEIQRNEQLSRLYEQKIQQYQEMESGNTELMNQIDHLRNTLEPLEIERSEKQSTAENVNDYNLKIEQELKKLRKAEELIKKEHSIYKDNKKAVFSRIQSSNFHCQKLSREVEYLRSYSTVDVELKTAMNRDSKVKLQEAEHELHELEEKFKNQSKTINSITLVEKELRNLVKIAKEVGEEVRKNQETHLKILKEQEKLDNKYHDHEQVKVEFGRLERQAKNFEEKISSLRQQSSERDAEAKQKLEMLELECDRVKKERDSKVQKLDMFKAENDALWNEMKAARAEFELEFRKTEKSVERLNAKIREYIMVFSNKFTDPALNVTSLDDLN